MGALSRPEEVLALVKLRVAAGQIKRQIPPEEHWAFGYSMLQKVSRSFALVIQQLGPELRNAVSTNSLHLPLSLFFSFHATRIRLRRHLESDAWRL
jgi:farnesyl-diphosphate farnesyltransferase